MILRFYQVVAKKLTPLDNLVSLFNACMIPSMQQLHENQAAKYKASWLMYHQTAKHLYAYLFSAQENIKQSEQIKKWILSNGKLQ